MLLFWQPQEFLARSWAVRLLTGGKKEGNISIVKTFTAAIWVVVVVIITWLNWTVTISITKALSSKATSAERGAKAKFCFCSSSLWVT